MKKPRRPSSLTRSALSALILSTSIASRLEAAPKVPQVTHGNASFQQSGDVLRITAGNGAVINYQSFDIGKGETVQFIQPNSSSRVMNRVLGEDPSRIFGSLLANGTVYLVNPNGIYFQNGSMINVGQLYAAAGHLSDPNFQRGQNQFSQLHGDVQNAGQITATGNVALAGQHVANYGSVLSQKGTVALVAGTEVLVGPRDGHIFVRAAGGPGVAAGAQPGVQNAGQVQAPRAIMGAGDLYSVALSNTGTIKAPIIGLQGGRGGAVNVSGTLDASATAPGTKGGRIAITGKAVNLQAATLNASGPAGGGTVAIGGGFQGKGKLAHAATTTMDAASTITADATVAGHGGKAVLWSDQSTQFTGTINARGAGDGHGGAAEVSSKGSLAYDGHADLTAPSGVTGTLLLDPTSIVVATGGAGTIPAGGTLSGGAAVTITISPSTLVTSLKTADVSLVATQDIIFQNGFDSTGNAAAHNLSLSAGSTIQIGQDFGAVDLLLKGSLSGAVTGAGGTISMLDGSSIQTQSVNGGIFLRQSNGVAGSISLASLNAGTGTVYLEAKGSVTQLGTGTQGILAGQLALRGNTFTLDSSHNTLVGAQLTIGTFASEATGDVVFRDTGDVAVGSISGTPGADVTGLSSGNVTLHTGSLAIGSVVDLGASKTLVLDTTGITQTALVTAPTLVILGSGAAALNLVVLNNNNNTTNDIQTLAANTSGSIDLHNNGALSLGTSGNVSGVTTTGNLNLALGGALTVNDLTSVGSSTFSLNSFGATQAVGKTISGGSLVLRGQGDFTLTEANKFTTLAGNFDGILQYTDADAITVSTVAPISGLQSNGKAITITSGGALSILQDINAGTADLGLLATGGSVSQTGGTITAGGLGLKSDGTPTLGTISGVTRVAAVIGTGGFTFSRPTLTVSTVAGLSGVTAGGGVNLTASTGDLTLDQSVTATGFNVQLTSTLGAVTEKGGFVKADALTVNAQSASSLDDKNLVSSLTATISPTPNGTASLLFYNDQALTTGAISAGDLSIEAKGALTLNGALNAAGSTVRLVSQGDLKQNASGIITANALGVRNLSTAGGDIVLTDANAIGSVAGENAATGGQFLLKTADSVTVTNVADGSATNFTFAAADGLKASGVIGLSTPNGLGIFRPIADASGTVYLIAGGGITQNGTGTITAGTLGILNGGANLALPLNNQLGTVGITMTSATGGGLVLRSATTGTTILGSVGPFSSGGFSFAGAKGFKTVGGGDVDIQVTGALQLDADLSAPGSTVRLVAQTGLSQTGGIITANGLGVRNNGASGDIILEKDNVLSQFAAANAAAGGAISFRNTAATGLSITDFGEVSPTGFNFALTQGVSTTAGNQGSNTIKLVTSGNLTLDSAVSAPQSDVLLQAGNQILENQGVTATGLAVVAGSSITSSGKDDISVLAGKINGSGNFTWTNTKTLTIGTVLGVDGINSPGTVTITTNTNPADLKLVSDVKGVGQVVLTAETGSVLETTGGVKLNSIGGLLVVAQDGASLGGPNSVATIAGRVTGTGSFTFANQGNLNVGTVNAVDGVIVESGDLNLQAGGTLQLLNQLTTNAGIVRLGATGLVSQTSDGLITAATLAARGAGVRLLAANQIINLAGAITSNALGLNFAVRSTQDDQIEVVKVAALTDGNYAFALTNGLATADPSQKIVLFNDQGGFSLEAPTVALGGAVYLLGNAGVTQTSAGVILAGSLAVRNDTDNANSIVLDADNNVGIVALFNASTDPLAGGIVFNSDLQAITQLALQGIPVAQLSTTLTVGTVPGFNPGLAVASTSGVTTSGGADISLGSGGGLSLLQNVNAGAGTVRFVTGGSLTMAGTTQLTAGLLGVINTSTTAGNLLLTGDLQVSTFAAKNAAASGAVFFAAGQAGQLTIGAVTALQSGSFDFGGATGVTAAADGRIGLQSQGALQLNQPLTTGSNDHSGSVLLVTNGQIAQADGAIITTGLLGLRDNSADVGDIVLTRTNSFTSVSGVNQSTGNSLFLVSDQSVTIGSVADVTSGNFHFAATTGLATNDGSLSLQTGGALVLNQDVNAGTGLVRLVADGAISQPGGAITAGLLGVEQKNDANTSIIALTGANEIAHDIAISNAGDGASTSLTTVGDLQTGSIAAQTDQDLQFLQTSGVSSNNGDIHLISGAGNVSLGQMVDAGTGAIELNAFGAVGQEANGALTAGGLLVKAGGNVSLLNPANQTNLIAAVLTGSGASLGYVDQGDITVGTVLGTSGVISNAGPVSLHSLGGAVLLVNDLTASGADVALVSDQGKVEESTGAVIASGLAVSADLSSKLTSPTNNVSRLAAHITGANETFDFASGVKFAVGQAGGLSGVKTSNGDISLTSAGTGLTLQQAVNAGAANVLLRANNGRLLEAGLAGKIIGGALTLFSGTGATLLSNNTVASLDATNGASGALQFVNAQPQLAVLEIAQGGHGPVLVSNSGDLSIAGPVSTPGDLTLVSNSGAIGQENAGTISAHSLTTVSGQGTMLTHGVSVLNFGATNLFSGAITFQSQGGLNLTGINNQGGNVLITESGALSSSGSVGGAGNVTLSSSLTQTLGGDLNAGGALLLQNSGGNNHIHVTGTVDAGGDFTVQTDGATSLGGAVKAGSVHVVGTNIAANDIEASGDAVLQTPGTLVLNGATYSGGTLSFNVSTPARLPSSFSSIIFTNPGLVTVSAGSAFAVGVQEKMVAFGSLSISGSQVTLGDTAAKNALTVSASQITLLDRLPSGQKIGTRPDRGLNIVAESIDFGGQGVTFAGTGNSKAFFSVGSGLPNAARTDGVTFFVDSQISDQFPTLAFTAPDPLTSSPVPNLPFQPIAGGVVDAQVVAALAGALPDLQRLEGGQEPRLSAATIAKLLSLGVSARDPDEEERKGIKRKRALFKQLIGKRNPTDADYQVVVNRIGPGQVTMVLEEYDRIFGPQQELKPRIEELFQNEYAQFVEKTGAADPGGFGLYLADRAKGDSDARNAMALLSQFRELFGDLGKIGFTPKEVQISEDVIARSLSIEGLNSSDFLNLVGVPRKTSTPLEAPPVPLQGAGDSAEGPSVVPPAPTAAPDSPAPSTDSAAPPADEPSSAPGSSTLPPLPPANPGTPGIPAGPNVPTTI